jgi:hypothetical protein
MLAAQAQAQAQKHVIVNEALRLLDGLVQLAVVDRHLSAPPPSRGRLHCLTSRPNSLASPAHRPSTATRPSPANSRRAGRVNIGSDTPGADGTMVVNTPTVTFANGSP